MHTNVEFLAGIDIAQFAKPGTPIVYSSSRLYLLEVYGVWVSLGLISLDIKPSTLGFTALRTPFIGVRVTGLRPLGVTPAHSSPFTALSGSLLWGNPRILAPPQTYLSWVFAIYPHLEVAPQ